jgi:hypothetical protein
VKLPGNRSRWAMGFALLGVVLMGVDLLVTRNFFTHVAELMVASLFCFILALVLDRSTPPPDNGSGS